jgi:hypothetical protein
MLCSVAITGTPLFAGPGRHLDTCLSRRPFLWGGHPWPPAGRLPRNFAAQQQIDSRLGGNGRASTPIGTASPHLQERSGTLGCRDQYLVQGARRLTSRWLLAVALPAPRNACCPGARGHARPLLVVGALLANRRRAVLRGVKLPSSRPAVRLRSCQARVDKGPSAATNRFGRFKAGPKAPHLGSTRAYDRPTRPATAVGLSPGLCPSLPNRHRRDPHQHTASSGWGGAR